MIAVSVLLEGVLLYPVMKFFVVSAIAVPLNFGVAGLVRRSGVLRRTF